MLATVILPVIVPAIAGVPAISHVPVLALIPVCVNVLALNASAPPVTVLVSITLMLIVLPRNGRLVGIVILAVIGNISAIVLAIVMQHAIVLVVPASALNVFALPVWTLAFVIVLWIPASAIPVEGIVNNG